MNILRWLLTIPAAYIAIQISTRYIYFGARHIGNKLMCPEIPVEVYLGSCMRLIGGISYCLLAFSSALLFVLLPSITAPSHRSVVAWVTFAQTLVLAGYVVATNTLNQPDAIGLEPSWPLYAQTVAASILIGGALSLWIVKRLLTHHSSGTPNGAPYVKR